MRNEEEIFTEPVLDSMFRYAMSLLGDRDEAMDAVHDVLEKLFRHKNPCLNSPRAFAMRAVRNKCIDRIRARKETSDRIPDAGQRAEADRWSEIQMVREAMSGLPEVQRTVLHLKDIEGFPSKEIAQIMGTGEGHVRMILSRARKALRGEILKALDE